MSQLVTMREDVYPFGCKGDVVRLNPEDLEKLRAIGKARRRTVYTIGTSDREAEANERAEAENEETLKQGVLNDDDRDETPELPEVSMADLRTRAKELNLPAGGSKEDLQVRIREAEANKPTGGEPV